MAKVLTHGIHISLNFFQLQMLRMISLIELEIINYIFAINTVRYLHNFFAHEIFFKYFFKILQLLLVCLKLSCVKKCKPDKNTSQNLSVYKPF